MIDGDYTTAKKLRPPRRTAPFPQTNEYCIIEQDYMQLRSSWAPTTIGTALAGEAGYELVAESPTRSEGSMFIWTRTYAKKPTAFDDAEKFPYNFIGYFGASGTITVQGRDRFVKSVASRIHTEFFTIGTGGDYADIEHIPINYAQKYHWPASEDQVTDFLCTAADGFDSSTTPSRATYEGWITAGTEIVAEDSEIARWMGRFFIRKTRYIIPQ